MIEGIGDVEIAVGIEGDGPGIVELARSVAGAAEDFDGTVVGVEYLNAAITELADVLVTVGIDADVVRIAKLAGCNSGLTVGAKEIAVGIEDLDAMVAGIGNVKATETIEAEPFGAVEGGVGGGC
jgi:hypothetical protein